MNRFLAFAALVAGALAGSEDGAGGYTGGYGQPSYGAPTAQVSSFMAAPPMSSSMMNSWQAWSTTTQMMATPTAVAWSSSMSMGASAAAPTFSVITSMGTPKSSGWPTSPMATHTVMVGGSSLVYTPPSLSGVKHTETIIFIFLEVNHTLTQSSFSSPCMSNGGFKSGFMPSNGMEVPFILIEFIDIMNTGSPMWFYCGQADHCERGMRFSINAANSQDMAWRAIDTTSVATSSMMMTTKTTMSSMSMATASVIPGMGTMSNGQCMCDCLCGVNSFPMGDGMGMMGGMPGMIPASAAPTMAVPMSSSAAYGGYGGSWK